jgi:uncharacterized protein (DUF1778 family)
VIEMTKDTYIRIRVDKETKKEVKDKAKSENRSMSNYIVDKLKKSK